MKKIISVCVLGVIIFAAGLFLYKIDVNKYKSLEAKTGNTGALQIWVSNPFLKTLLPNTSQTITSYKLMATNDAGNFFETYFSNSGAQIENIPAGNWKIIVSAENDKQQKIAESQPTEVKINSELVSIAKILLRPVNTLNVKQ